MAPSGTATIKSLNYDRTLRKSWDCRLLKRAGPELMFVGEFAREIIHSELGVIESGTVSYEYYWLDRWFNIFRFHEPDGRLRNYYCNVNMPPTFEGSILQYVDLDLDLLIWPDMSYSILDREEFEANAMSYGYPDKVIKSAEAALSELITMAENGKLPKE